jgi:hypothetical protein
MVCCEGVCETVEFGVCFASMAEFNSTLVQFQKSNHEQEGRGSQFNHVHPFCSVMFKNFLIMF